MALTVLMSVGNVNENGQSAVVEMAKAGACEGVRVPAGEPLRHAITMINAQIRRATGRSLCRMESAHALERTIDREAVTPERLFQFVHRVLLLLVTGARHYSAPIQVSSLPVRGHRRGRTAMMGASGREEQGQRALSPSAVAVVPPGPKSLGRRGSPSATQPI